MIIAVYLLLVLFLLLLNAFFVLAEFAVVKVRPTQIEVLAAHGSRRAKRVLHIQKHLDVFLSVCQIGITLASIGLGFVGEPAFAALLKPLVRWAGAGAATDLAAHGIAVSLAYVLVSFLHILIGELIPKSMALRTTERSALLIAYPMMVFHYLFIAPMWVLNFTVNVILRLCRMPPADVHANHTEDEIRVILSQSQSSGVISFRRLLFIENVLDLGTLSVRNAMQPRAKVRYLRIDATRATIDAAIAEHRYSRYPVLTGDQECPGGYVHVKDLYLAEHAGKDVSDLRALIHPCLVVKARAPLEPLLADMQRKGNHMAVVQDDQGNWAGIITMEDAIEEVIGTIEEEFPLEKPVRLSDLLTAEKVLLDVKGDSIISATNNALSYLATSDLPVPLAEIIEQVAAREKVVSSYMGRRLAIPHARLPGLTQPLVVVARLAAPMPAPVRGETIMLLFILLTPANAPRIHQILLSHIAGIFSSEFLEDRLCSVSSSMELYKTICTAEQTALA